MKICIIILYSKSWQEIADIVIPNLEKYAKKHNYNTFVRCYEEPFSGFEKLEWAEFYMKDYEAVWSLDCDTLITNHSIRIEDFIDNEHTFFLCEDYNGLNCGSFIISKTEWANVLLEYLMKKRGMPKMYCEQDAINAFIIDKPYVADAKIKVLPHPSINSYLYNLYPEIPLLNHEQGQWQKGDFVLHLPGVSMQKRLDILKQKTEEIIYE